MSAAKLALDTPIEKLPLVGPAYAKRLGKLGIETIENLLHHYPHRYDDFSLVSPISQIQPGETVTLKGEISSINNLYTRGGKQIQKAVVTDKTGWLEAVWFNQPFLIKYLPVGTKVALAGKIQDFLGKASLVSPEYEVLKSFDSIHTGRLVPVYPETASLSSKWLRSRVAIALRQSTSLITDWLPDNFKKKYQLLDLNSALRQIHFPDSREWIKKAEDRLAFDELLLLHLQSLERKAGWQKKKVGETPFVFKDQKIKDFISHLPYKLTQDQKRAVQQILGDLKKSRPANRLLQGDVGSGKTVVAAIACYATYLSGHKSVFMVPTAILAEQHLKTLEELLKPYRIKIGFFTSSHKEKTDLKEIDLFLGTHALLHRKLDSKNIGLMVIDEQHRFGVEQRSTLINQSTTPHLLTMTATPIPRTVALTLYADLDLSLIEIMPKGRKPVKTWVIPKQKRPAAYDWIKREIIQNHSQVFIICPLIEESEHERLADVKAATQEFNRLKKIFARERLSLLHGRVKTRERQKIMKQLTEKKIDILVSTPVVEVGIDIPNATVMIIEAAERFGLAQLHQLRGRVGRGKKQAYCLLFSEVGNSQNLKRLKAMEQFNSGLKLAELDLKIRGPGDVYGTRQSGFLNLKIASFSNNQLIAQTRKAAEDLFLKSSQYPELQEKLKKITIRSIKPN